MSSIKVREKTSNKVTNVRVLISHPMETGLRKYKKGDKKGQKIPAHFIQEVICKFNGKMVMTAELGPAISKNPYLSFKTSTGAIKQGDTIDISWVDNKGNSDSQSRVYKNVDGKDKWTNK